ncbi:Disease resistance protein RGA2 [Dichanthelium oligosanthes]|uniref:Disease resistance protein RGA2 n=1 Tax=Dichanthelium oligosanthes TaxID=888268 RepID=A0A1E5VKQ6_9POAL|nr:Disease resistance protein RGA2 [Dichanthelium oligosanthes]
MDASDPSSPHGLQTSKRPPRLAVRKDSHKIIKKAPVTVISAAGATPGEFRAMVQRLTGRGATAPVSAAPFFKDPKGPSVAPPLRFQPPPELLRSPTAAHSLMLPAIETAVRPLIPLPTASYLADAFVEADTDRFAAVLGPPGLPGILSPAVLPPVAFSGQFSPLPFNPSCLSWFCELFPFLHTAGTRVEGLWAPFALKKHSLLLATPATPSPATVSMPEIFSNVRDIKSGQPAREGGDDKRRGEAEPTGGDRQVGVDIDCSIRRLFQQLVHVRTTISSSSSGALPSDAWFDNVKHLSSDAEEYLEDLFYKIIVAILGVGRHCEKVMSNVPGTSSETTSINSIELSSQEELAILSITDKLESLEHGPHGSPGLPGAVLGNYSDMVSLGSLVMRCILLCRGLLGIMSTVGAEGRKETLELPLFASDDLTYIGHKKVSRMDTHSIPTSVIDPMFLLPIFIRSLLYLDLSSCSSLTQLPPSIGNLHNLVALNLSYCYSLRTLPVSLGRLKNLQILSLSCCHELRYLPVSLCELSKLRLLDLAGCSSLENLPDSLVNLGHLENLNLSDCKELKELPQPFGNLQELKYLNLSGSHGVDLDVEYLCKLANLKCLTLLPLTNIQGFPDSFRDLANSLDRLRWWKNNRVHPQCNPKAASLHSYRCYEQGIIDRLLLSDEDDISSDQIITSICIAGESGMGKTELVRQIYCDRMILDTFNLRIWVCMCDKKRLLCKIVEFTTGAYCTEAPIGVLEEIVIEELAGKRLLLVLHNSDSKSQYFWSYVRKLLNVCAKGSALIVTTKSNEVVNLVGAMQTHYLRPVSKEECFMIFKGHVLGGLDMNSYPQLESIGWKVVEKCGGNPTCIKALSGLLCHSELGMAEIDMLVDGTLPALRLCYDLLPSHLKQCLKFCSLFPKDYIFIKHHIVRLWISQGFVFPEEGNQPEDTGLHYFDELLCRSFFQRSPFHSDQDDMYVMHELFRDLATSVSKNECFRCEEPFCSVPENICHLSLVLSDFKTVALAKEARNLQSFLVFRRSFPVVRILHSNDLFMKYQFLRAVNLSYTDILDLPSSIGDMKHLRFLALNRTKIKGLPIEIGQVKTLQTLELNYCCLLTDLPESTSNLVKLRHLDVQKEPGNIKVGMPHGIGQLTDLQTLTEFNIGNNLSQCSIAELKNLNGLRGHVHVTGLENIKMADDAREANIVGKHFLEALTLEWSYSDEGMNDGLGQEIANKILQNLEPNSNLQNLVVQNYPGNLFPLWMQDSYLSKLVSITLDNCYGCSELPYIGDLPSLKFLFIQRMNDIESFGIESNSLATEEKHPPRFPSLEVLTLWEMYDLQFWVGTNEWDFPRICRLSISRCPKLRNLPPLRSLVHLSVHCSGQVPSFSELPSLESLKIEGFHKTQSISFPHQLTMLKKLEISDCKELSSMFAYSLSVSDLKVARCLKLDLVGNSLEDHHTQKVDGGRKSPARRSMVLKTGTYTDLRDDSWKWEKHGETNIFGSNLAR